MHHCLSICELKEVIYFKLLGQPIQNTMINSLVDEAENWEVSLGCLVYFFSCILEKRVNSDEEVENLIRDFFELDSSLHILIQEFDNNFIDHLIRNTREKELMLEDELIRIQTNIAEFNYDKTLRF